MKKNICKLILLIILIIGLFILNGCINIREENNCIKSGGQWRISKDNPTGICECLDNEIVNEKGFCIPQNKE